MAGVPTGVFTVVAAAPVAPTGLGTAVVVVVFVVTCAAGFAGFAVGTRLAEAGRTVARGRFTTGAVCLTGVTVAGVEPSAGGNPQLAGGGSGVLGATSGGGAVVDGV